MQLFSSIQKLVNNIIVLFTSLALNEDFFLCVPTIGTRDKIGVRNCIVKFSVYNSKWYNISY